MEAQQTNSWEILGWKNQLGDFNFKFQIFLYFFGKKLVLGANLLVFKKIYIF